MATALDDLIDDDAHALEQLDGLVGYHLRRAMAIVATDFTRAMAGTGMRQVLFGILSTIARRPGINQGNVGRLLGIQRANMVNLVSELVDRGLVLRETSPDDRRAFALSLTVEGEDAVERCRVLIAAHEAELLAEMSAAERATLIGLLRRIEAREV